MNEMFELEGASLTVHLPDVYKRQVHGGSVDSFQTEYGCP